VRDGPEGQLSRAQDIVRVQEEPEVRVKHLKELGRGGGGGGGPDACSKRRVGIIQYRTTGNQRLTYGGLGSVCALPQFVFVHIKQKEDAALLLTF
jgi:hypothetical protein